MDHLDYTYEDLLRTLGMVMSGPPEDGDICVPQVAADHLEKHGVAPGDFFREGIRTLDNSTPTKFSVGMSHRIRPIIRNGFGWMVRLWRSIQTLPDDWMKKDQAVAWFVRQVALQQFPLPALMDGPNGMPVERWRELDRRVRARHDAIDKYYKGLFVSVDNLDADLLDGPVIDVRVEGPTT